MDFLKNTYFQNINNCFAWCHSCPEDLVGDFCLFKALVFTTEHILEIGYVTKIIV